MIKYLEVVLLENPNFVADWKRSLKEKTPLYELHPCNVPEGVTERVPYDRYYEFKKGAMTGNGDLVVCTRLENGKLAVLALLRGEGIPFANTLDMAGGGVPSYTDIVTHLLSKTKKECGFEITPQAIIGAYRNDAPDVPSSVMAMCHVAYVPVAQLRALVEAGDEHHKWTLLTEEDLDNLPSEQTYMYAMHVWRKVLAAALEVLK